MVTTLTAMGFTFLPLSTINAWNLYKTKEKRYESNNPMMKLSIDQLALFDKLMKDRITTLEEKFKTNDPKVVELLGSTSYVSDYAIM